MSTSDRQRWDERYSSGDYVPRRHPSRFVEAALDYVAPGRALVIACGTGRNALRLAEAGFDVDAVDVSSVAIDIAREEAARRGLEVDWQVADIAELPLEEGMYDLITMIRYTNREILPGLERALRANGWILMEQHLRTPREVVGPGDDFRYAPGELLDTLSHLRIVHYSEAFEPSDRQEGMTATIRLLACKGDPGW